MPTMNVNLTPKLAEFVNEEIASGDYASASELVRDALRLLKRDRESEVEKLEILRREIALGVEQAERGEFSDLSVSDIAARIRAERG
jgi:antitoxin ParD1/3/4